VDARLSVSGLCFPGLDLDHALARLDEVGARRTTLMSSVVRAAGWDAGVERLRSADLSLAALIDGPPFELAEPGTWQDTRSRMVDTIDAAAALGVGTIYMVTGRRVGHRWTDAVDALAAAMHPVVEHAERSGVRLAVEPTNPLYSDMSFVHSLSAGLELAERLGMGVCLDLFHVWTEAHLEQTMAGGVDRIALVQVSDYVLGDRSFPCRAVPGDGSVPLAELLRVLFAAGYAGTVDLELSGPRIDAEGHLDAARRAVARLDEILTDGSGRSAG
jgi:sugar phosphate isomerase/epimerase